MNKISLKMIQLLLIALLFENGLAIKCYNCDSAKNPSCTDLHAGSGIVAETCTPSKMGQEASTWLRDIIKIDYFQSAMEVNVPMLCQKIIAVNENNERTTIRSCQIDGGKTDPCTIATGKAKIDNRIKIEHCSVCDKDNCNSATDAKVWLPIILAACFATILRDFL